MGERATKGRFDDNYSEHDIVIDNNDHCCRNTDRRVIRYWLYRQHVRVVGFERGVVANGRQRIGGEFCLYGHIAGKGQL